MNNSKYITQNDLLLKNLISFYNTNSDNAFNPNNNLILNLNLKSLFLFIFQIFQNYFLFILTNNN